MNRTASAQWTGDLRTGKGTMSTSSGVFKDIPYSFVTRFENSPGTNPEELIAAAHAGCFTMALSGTLWRAGFTAKRLSTNATLTIEQVEGKWTITTIHLDLTADVPGVGKDEFAKLAAEAKANCPVSRLLNANITLDARLQQA
jgi:osmotically inducible protein OsmC